MAKITKMPNRRFVMDKNNPERTMNYFHECLDNELNKLSERMQQICDKYDLYHPADDLFVDYDPIQLGEIVVPIQTMFTRCDFLLRMFECHIIRNTYVDCLGT